MKSTSWKVWQILLAMDRILRIMKGLSAKFLIHFEMWRDLKPLGFERERERERTKGSQRWRKRGKKCL